jgi:hypothetical protein
LNGEIHQGNTKPQVVFTCEEDATMVAWMLGIQDYGLSIALQHPKPKMKVAKFM